MKRLIAFASITIALTAISFGQSKDEQDIRKIHASLDEAFLKKDVAAFERIFADDFTFAGTTGTHMNRAQTIDDIRKEMSNTTYKVLSAGTDNVQVRTLGDMAIVTGDWRTSSVTSAEPNGEPHNDKGRYTGVYQRRGGNWQLIAEHWSEAPHDKKLMEQQVMKAGQAYNDMIRKNDLAGIERVLASDYMYTTSDGQVRTRDQEIARLKERKSVIEIADSTDQKVRIIGNGAAIETATFRVKGTNSGKPFDEMERYTTTWAWRDGRWQIVADHTSAIKK